MGLHMLGGLPPLIFFVGSPNFLSIRLLGLLYLHHPWKTMYTTFRALCVHIQFQLDVSIHIGLSRTFPHGRVAHKHKFVELPLILRGHSLGQSKFFGSLSTWSFDVLGKILSSC